MNDTDSIPTARPSWLVTLLCLVVVIGGAIGAIALIGNSSADAATPRTQKIVIRPVTASGHAARGFKVVTDHRHAIECYEAAPTAVDAGIADCGYTSDYTPACWASATKGRVLCLSDPYTRTLHSIKLSGAFPALRAPKHSSPQALTLTNGQKYLVRISGAVGTPAEHPSWIKYYFERTSYLHGIYGPSKSDSGINHRHKQWFVTTYVHESGHGTRHDVAKAYYVGTAR